MLLIWGRRLGNLIKEFMATSALDPQIDLDPFLTQRIGHKYQIFQGAYPQPSNKEHYSDFSCSCVVCVMPIYTWYSWHELWHPSGHTCNAPPSCTQPCTPPSRRVVCSLVVHCRVVCRSVSLYRGSAVNKQSSVKKNAASEMSTGLNVTSQHVRFW